MKAPARLSAVPNYSVDSSQHRVGWHQQPDFTEEKKIITTLRSSSLMNKGHTIPNCK